MKKILALTLTILVAVGMTLGVSASRAAVFDSSDARVTTDRTDYQPGETVIISGTGFLAGENIRLEITREGMHYRTLGASADEYGNFSNKELVINEDDRGASFTVTATGETSNYSARSRFTDGTLSYIPVTQEYTNVVVGTAAVTRTFEVQVSVPAPDAATNATATCTQRGNSDNYDCAKPYSLTLNGVGFPAGFTVSSAALTSTSGTVTSHFKLSNGIYTLVTQGASALVRWNVTVTIPGGTVANASPGYTGTIIASGTTAGHSVGVGTAVIIRVSNPAPVDNEAPVTTASAVTSDNASYSTATWTNKNVSVTLESVDGPTGTATGVAKIEYNIDNGGYVAQLISPASVNAQHTITPAISTEGIHTIFWRATDAQGNIEVPPAQGFTVKIDKTKPVISLNGSASVTIPYGGSYTDASATATDNVGGSGLAGGVTVTGTVDTNVVGAYTLTFNVSDNAGNAADTVTRTVHVVKAEQTIDFGPLSNKTYGEPDFAVNATAGSGEPVSFSASGNCTVTANVVHITGAGSCTITADEDGNANYNAAPSVSQSFNIGKAATTTTVTCADGPFTYTGAAQTPCSASVTGPGLNEALSVNYSDNANAGTATASASYAESDNYQASSDSKNFSIGKAPSTTTVTCSSGPFTYTGAAQTPCSVSVTGAGGLSLMPAPIYVNNINAGTATASYTYVGGDNHLGSEDSETFEIGKANATISVSGFNGIFDGAEHGATGSASGVNGENLNSLLDLGAKFTNVPGGTATWTFNSGNANGNYNFATDSVAITIDKASSTTTVTCGVGPFTYTGSAIEPCSVSVTGAGGLDLIPTPDYANNVNAGTASASYTYAESANHLGSSDSKTFQIGKASSTVTVTCPANQTYTGSPIEPCMAKATGAGDLNETLTVSYSNNTNAGPATATASYAGDDNHDGSNGNGGFTIDKAPTVTSVTCEAGPFIYNGSAHKPCSANVTGAGGLNQTLSVNYSNNLNAGTASASAAYAESANHLGSSDSKTFQIGKANATINVTGYTGYYDGQPHGASGTATGVNDEDLSGLLNLGSTFTNVPGGTAEWKFNESATNGNYNSANGIVHITIQNWTVSGFYQPVDMTPQGSTVLVLNSVKGGSTVPLKFELFAGNTEKTSTADIQGFQSQEFNCAAALSTLSEVEITTTGGTSLRYDMTAGQFIQNWQTPKAAGKCYQVRMTAKDGSKIDAFFKTK